MALFSNESRGPQLSRTAVSNGAPMCVNQGQSDRQGTMTADPSGTLPAGSVPFNPQGNFPFGNQKGTLKPPEKGTEYRFGTDPCWLPGLRVPDWFLVVALFGLCVRFFQGTPLSFVLKGNRKESHLHFWGYPISSDIPNRTSATNWGRQSEPTPSSLLGHPMHSALTARVGGGGARAAHPQLPAKGVLVGLKPLRLQTRTWTFI